MLAIVRYTRGRYIEGYEVNGYIYINAKSQEEAVKMYEEEKHVKITEVKEGR